MGDHSGGSWGVDAPGGASTPHDRDGGFEHLVREHHTAVVAYARRRLGDWQGAEDVAAETFVVAWRRRANGSPADCC